MSKIYCDGKTASDCWSCGKYYSSHSSHYDSYYDCRVEEVNCCVGGNRIFKDEDNDKRRLY